MTDDDDLSNDSWDAAQWAAHDASMAPVDDTGARSLAWPAEVATAAPQQVLDFLQDCSVSDGCELLAGWAASGLPGLKPSAGGHSDRGIGAAGGECGCTAGAGGGLCAKHAAWRNLCQAWASSFADSDLEAVQQIARCITRLGRRHAELQPASAAALRSMQCKMIVLHGSQLRVAGVFE
jgi:hypothetical protein